MRRLLTIALLASLSLLFHGCGGGKKTETADNSSNSSDEGARPSRSGDSGGAGENQMSGDSGM